MEKKLHFFVNLVSIFQTVNHLYTLVYSFFGGLDNIIFSLSLFYYFCSHMLIRPTLSVRRQQQQKINPEEAKITFKRKQYFSENKVRTTFNLLTCRQEMLNTFQPYWHVCFIPTVGLHSTAGLWAELNQYWKSKALVLCVYRSMLSAGLCFLGTFWSPSVCPATWLENNQCCLDLFIVQIKEGKLSLNWVSGKAYQTCVQCVQRDLC